VEAGAKLSSRILLAAGQPERGPAMVSLLVRVWGWDYDFCGLGFGLGV
jgi:hypothetical protein